MKNVFKLLGIIALVTIIIFSATACSGDEGGGEPSYDTPGGSNVTMSANSLTLKGKVYEIETTMKGYIFNEFKGNLTLVIDDGITLGSGSVSGGSLNYTINSPPSSSDLMSIQEYFEDATYSNTNAKGFMLNGFSTNNNFYLSLLKISFSASSEVYEQIYFLYVDTPVTIIKQEEKHQEFTLSGVNLSLTQGWNTICEKEEYSMSGGKRSMFKMTSIPSSFTWVLQEVYGAIED